MITWYTSLHVYTNFFVGLANFDVVAVVSRREK